MEEKFWYLKNCDLFERLNPEQIQRVEASAQTSKFDRGSLVYLPTDRSDAVLLLLSGRIKLYHITAEGKQALLALIEPGELFGELALVESGQREEFAEAMLASQVVLIPRSVVTDLMNEHPEVALGVTKLIGLRRRRIERRLKSLLFRSNREKLIYLLLELAEKYGRPTPKGIELSIKLAHQELANIIGSTRETVTVLLGELQSEGAVRVERRRITLGDVEELARTIDVAPPRLNPVPSSESSMLTRPRTT